MKITFRERQRKKSNHESLANIINIVLPRYIKPEVLTKLKLEVFLGPIKDCGSCIAQGCLPYRNFRIDINNTKPAWRIKQTLRHELIHVKQIVNEEQIPFTDDFKILWKGVDHTYTEYWSQPWEIEAYALENIR